jgi:dolichol-phosphate mannosyltransferase
MTVYVLLPCYNEESNLGELVAKISEACRHISYKIVAVDDGSKDNTLSLLSTLSEKYPVVVLRHEVNKGLHEALRTLLLWMHDNAGMSDYAITMDSDLTHDPKYIPDLLSACEKEGTSVAIASRYVGKSEQVGVPFHRALLSKGLHFYVKASLGLPAKDVSSGYRCIRSADIKKLVEIYGRENLIEARGFEVQLELLFKLFVNGARITEIPFTLDYSKKRGKSKLKVRRTISGYLKTVPKLKHLQKQMMSP